MRAQETYKVAEVVRCTAVAADKVHLGILGDVIGIVLEKVRDMTPQGWNGGLEFIESDSEPVGLVVLGHVFEWIVRDVTEEFDVRFNSPIPFIILHQRVLEEKARLKSTHMTIRFRIAVDDVVVGHLLPCLRSLLLVDVIWIAPVLLGDATIFGGSRDKRGGDTYELVVKLFIVEEYPVIMKPGVEAILDVTNGLGQAVEITVPGQRHKGGICSRSRSFIGWGSTFGWLVGLVQV